jgi:hypothetical protein
LRTKDLTKRGSQECLTINCVINVVRGFLPRLKELVVNITSRTTMLVGKLTYN